MSSNSSEIRFRESAVVDESRPGSALSGPQEAPDDVMQRLTQLEVKLSEEAGKQTDLLQRLLTLQERPIGGPDQDLASHQRFTPPRGGADLTTRPTARHDCTDMGRPTAETSLPLPGFNHPRVPQASYRPSSSDWITRDEWESAERRVVGSEGLTYIHAYMCL